MDASPVHQSCSSSRSRATSRMYAKIATRTIVPMAPIARRTVVDSLGTVGPLAAGADAGAEADARAGAAGRIRRGGLHRIGEGELLVRGRVRAAEHLRRRHLLERVLDRVREWDVQSADLEDLDPERRKVRLRIRERALFDVVQARREVDDLQPVGLHLTQGHVELLDDLVLDAVLDLRRGGGAERPDELVDERLRVLQAVPEVPERAE